MKSVGALALFTVVVLLLRSTALTALAARGVVVDVLVFAVAVWALRSGESWGASFGFMLGLAADLDAAHWLGRHALVLSLLGYAIGRLSHTLVRDSARTHVVLLVLGTVLHQAWVALFEVNGVAAWPYLLQRVVLAAVATAPIGTVILAVARRLAGASLFGHAAVESSSTS